VVRLEREGAVYIFFIYVSFLEDFNATACLRLLLPSQADDSWVPAPGTLLLISGFFSSEFFFLSLHFFTL